MQRRSNIMKKTDKGWLHQFTTANIEEGRELINNRYVNNLLLSSSDITATPTISMSPTQVPASISDINEPEPLQDFCRIRKTPAERARDYRARKKLSKEQRAHEKVRTVKTSTERSREHRMRKKLAKESRAQFNRSTLMDNSMPDLRPSTSNSTINAPLFDSPEHNDIDNEHSATVKKRPKTAAERAREYRTRKKRLWSEIATRRLLNTPVTSQQSNVTPPLSNISILNSSGQNVNGDKLVVAEKGRPKNAAERAREYRARQRLLTESVSWPSTSLTNAGITEHHIYPGHKRNNNKFHKEFRPNLFYHACTICERVLFKDDLNHPDFDHHERINVILPGVHINDILLCRSCKQELTRGGVTPTLSVYNGYKYLAEQGCSIDRGNIRQIKEDSGDIKLDIGATTLQHMDYRTKQQETIAVKQESSTNNHNFDVTLCRAVKQEFIEIELMPSDVQQCAQTTSKLATGGSETMDQDVGIKNELEDTDLDIGPTVLQHMDTSYRTNQQNTGVVEREGWFASSGNYPELCNRFDKDSVEDKCQGTGNIKKEKLRRRGILRRRSLSKAYNLSK